jgi:hypothetical protein
MRSLLLSLIVAGSCAGTLTAQDSFSDPDFGFTLTLPAGLHEVTQAERARILGVSEELARNVPRGEIAPGQPLAHHYFWVDRSSPYNRQMDVHLFDAVPPYRKAEEVVEAYKKMNVVVDGEPDHMKSPVGGLRIEGTFMNPQQIQMRKTVLYLPDPLGKRYGIVSMQCYAGDWAIVKPEFLQSLLSVRLPRVQAPAGAGPGADGAGGGRPGAAATRTGAGVPGAPTHPADWKSLPVAGSLVLAVLLLGHLLLGGRGVR